jgi:XTP/dITP diphosphohydrolase
MRVLIATSNAGKLHDFRAAAAEHGIVVEPLPGFDSVPEAVEDGATFEENGRRKAEHYSRYAAGELVLADDSGLAVDALGGAPGAHSARYAEREPGYGASDGAAGTDAANKDVANNARLLREMEAVGDADRAACFVCVISAARDGAEVAHFRGEAQGTILRAERGTEGFGYDPLFYLPRLGKSFAELSPQEKSAVSHRGAAFRKFLEWARADGRAASLP